MPVDTGVQNTPSSSLSTDLKITLPENDPVKEKTALSDIIKLLGSRNQSVVVIDGGMNAIVSSKLLESLI